MTCEIIPEKEIEAAVKAFNGDTANFYLCWAQNDLSGVFMREMGSDAMITPLDTRMALAPFLKEEYHLVDAQALYYSPSHIYIAVYS